jgi:hypothetical protein
MNSNVKQLWLTMALVGTTKKSAVTRDKSMKRNWNWVIAISLGMIVCGVEGRGQVSPPPPGPPAGWYGDGRTPIAVLRPSTWIWYMATSPTGSCPFGFSPQPNSDHTPLCLAQFGLPGDQVLPGYYSQMQYEEPGVFRPGDGKVYFLPRTGICPTGSASAGTLASGHLYCFQASIVQPGTKPLYWVGVGVGYWDPHSLTFAFPATYVPGGPPGYPAHWSCPDGFLLGGTVCKLTGWGNLYITPIIAKYNGSPQLGFYDPANRWVHMLQTGGVPCPLRSYFLGGLNGATTCGRPWTGAGQLVDVRDGDYDGMADLFGYDPTTGKWTFMPTNGGCQAIGWTYSGKDAYGSSLCTNTLGGPSFVPIVGDYDNDGKADAAVWNTQTGVWTIVPSSGLCPANTNTVFGQQVQCQRQFGLPGDQLLN